MPDAPQPDSSKPAPPPANNPPPPAGADPASELEALRKEVATLRAAASKPAPDFKPKPEDMDLQERARLFREARDKEDQRTAEIEKAVDFINKSADFIRLNEALLPKDAADIFKQAEKESFNTKIDKAAALKAGLVQSFFSVQANVDLLTPGQKATLEDYQKLTKSGKQERIQMIYDMVFEPAFERLKGARKAEALNKGYGGGNGVEDAFKNKIMKVSRRHYLGEKHGS